MHFSLRVCYAVSQYSEIIFFFWFTDQLQAYKQAQIKHQQAKGDLEVGYI